MKVIICGAAQTGYNIAAYLCKEDNDITVIDPDQKKINEINDTLDANGIVGFPSHPDTLKDAGIEEADIIIAVTDVDEVNMVTCQVAHSLFGVPKKIAKIKTNNYLDPAWANLFARAHMPIDVIISPEAEVAEAVLRRIKVPGVADIIPLIGGEVFVVGVHCNDDCPILNTPLRQLKSLFPDIAIQILSIIRGEERIIANTTNQLLAQDEVYFLVKADQLYRALSIFGHDEPDAHNIVVFGGGNIGRALAQRIPNELKSTRIKIIEIDQDRAEDISEELENVLVINGDGLNKNVLEEASVDKADVFVALSEDDENNILVSLLAKQFKSKRTMSLINKPIYMDMANAMGIDAIISPRAITVSKILQHVRRGRINGIYNIHDGFAEIIEAEVSGMSTIVNKVVRELKLPDTIRIGMIWRDGEIILPQGDTMIKEKDIVILISLQQEAKKVENLFSVNFDLLDL